MRISEFEYHVLSTLVTMKDRDLAQKCELDIFRYGPSPDNRRLALYVQACKDSHSEENCVERFRTLIEESGMEFTNEEKWIGTPHARVGVKIDNEEYMKRLLAGELLECK